MSPGLLKLIRRAARTKRLTKALCRAFHALQVKRWKHANPDKVRESRRTWRFWNPKKRQAQVRRWKQRRVTTPPSAAPSHSSAPR